MISNNLSGKTIVIIGGTSGIGRAVAEMAHQAGAKVIITGRDLDRTKSAASQIGNNVLAFKVNVDSDEDVKYLFDEVTQADHIYIAAGDTKITDISNGSLDENMQAFNTRVLGSLRIVRAAFGKISNGGSVTFTGGVSTDRPIAGAWVSGLGTATAEQLAKVLVMEIPGVRFNAVSPGYTDTPMWDRIMAENKETILSDIALKLPAKKIATPQEVAMAVLFLMANPSVTGEVIHIDGGARLV